MNVKFIKQLRVGGAPIITVKAEVMRLILMEVGMVSVNCEDKIKFVKDGMSKESLDDLLRSLETHPSEHVQREINNLWKLFKKKSAQFSLGNLTLKDHICQFIRKLDGKPTVDP
ncbi:hypothetical protein WN943_010687 [Citrus x changshan-huyou]